MKGCGVHYGETGVKKQEKDEGPWDRLASCYSLLVDLFCSSTRTHMA